MLEIVAGGAMLAAAAVLWGYRKRLVRRPRRLRSTPRGRSSAILGATITAVELPTAFPYFAAIAALVGANLSVVRIVFLLVIFNVCFVLPLLGILARAHASPGPTRNSCSPGDASGWRHVGRPCWRCWPWWRA